MTGISALVDPYGRVHSHLGVGEQGFLVDDLRPVAKLTPRARWGDWWAVFCAIAATAVFIVGRRRTVET